MYSVANYDTCKAGGGGVASRGRAQGTRPKSVLVGRRYRRALRRPLWSRDIFSCLGWGRRIDRSEY